MYERCAHTPPGYFGVCGACAPRPFSPVAAPPKDPTLASMERDLDEAIAVGKVVGKKFLDFLFDESPRARTDEPPRQRPNPYFDAPPGAPAPMQAPPQQASQNPCEFCKGQFILQYDPTTEKTVRVACPKCAQVRRP